LNLENIAAAGNTEIPAYLTLIKLGYAVERTVHANGDEEWIAKNGTFWLVGDGPLQLLGLCAMRTERGVDWRPLDSEIDQFLAQFYQDTSSKQPPLPRP
jgi:hypothetical protein